LSKHYLLSSLLESTCYLSALLVSHAKEIGNKLSLSHEGITQLKYMQIGFVDLNKGNNMFSGWSLLSVVHNLPN